MPTVVLVRHGRTEANASGVLAGWSPGVFLDEEGRKQAEVMASRLITVPLSHVVSSPLDRTVETADFLCSGRKVKRSVDEGFGECRYGDWTGKKLAALAKEPMWRVVQDHPSAARFPGADGETLSAMQHRAVSAIRTWNDVVGSDAIYAVVSHGDVIKAILADALGMHLDSFQRICVDPCSISIVSYTPTRPFVHRMNDTSQDPITWKLPSKRKRRSSDATVGGGVGGGK